MELDDPSTPITDITPITPNDNNEAANSEEQPNKRRRKKSIVWEHFTIETVGAGCMRACCKQCKKSFAYITGSKLAGTSHLKRHIALGICPVSRQKNEGSPFATGTKSEPPKKRYRASPGFANIPFDQDRCTQEIAKMIIQHEYPLHMVEHPAFIEFVRTLQPQYKIPSFNSIEGDCVAIYLREKQSLFNLICGIPGRVNLTLDLGISNASIGYAFLTGHFIDRDWNLHRRLLNVVMLPFPDSEYAFNQAVVSCLSDWHLENGLFTLTLDQSFASETMTGNLRGLVSVRNPLVLNGQLLKGNCYARVLSRLAQDMLGAMGETIGRIRESVKYVKTSESHDEKFAELRQQLQVPSTKELIIDDQTKWNTTYHMLVAACELKEVFTCLDTCDPVYKINPSIDDWKAVEVLCTYLKLLFDAANILTGPTYPAANAFYHEVSKIQLELTHAAISQDPFVSNLTRPLKEKFDQYWKECFLVMAIAVVMDPRFKMKLIEFSFTRLFGEDAGMWIKIVDDGIHELFLDYLAPTLSLPSTYVEEENMGFPNAESPRELVMVPPQDGPSQEVSDEVPLQVVCPEEAPPQDVKPEVAFPDMQPQQEVHFQGVPEEMHPQEMPAQGVLPEEMHLQDVSHQDMQTQEALQGMQPQEAPAQGVLPQEMDAREVPPPQQVDTQDVMPPQQLDTQDVMPSQQLDTQDVMPPQQVDTQDAMPPQQEDTQEVQPPQQEDTQEVQPPQQEDMREVQPPQREDASEVQPPQQEDAPEVHPPQQEDAREVQPPHQEDAQEVQPPQDMGTQEVPPQPQEMDTQGEVNDTQEVPQQEMDAQEEVNKEMQLPQEVDIPEVPPTQEVDTQELQPSQEPPQELDNQEVQAPQEVDTQVVQAPQDMDAQDIHPPQDMDTQDIHPPQDMDIQEVSPQGMDGQEVVSQEINPPPQEMHPQEVPFQEMHLQEVSTQGLPHEEAPSQEVRAQEEVPQEMQAQEEVPQGMHTQEEVPLDMHTEEVHPQEVPNQQVHTQETMPEEMHTQEVPAKEPIPSQGVSSEEMQTQVPSQELHIEEVPPQGFHSHEVTSHEMHSHVLHHEIHHQDINTQDLPLLSLRDGFSDFDAYISEITNIQHMKSELDQYLEESLLPRVQEFDVLGWWKLNKLKYPTLAKLAADILSIPVSTVGPESVFDTRSKKIDNYHGSLRPVTLEALICSKDWLQYGSSSLEIPNNAIVKMDY